MTASETYTVATIAGRELDELTPANTGREGRSLLETAGCLAAERCRQGHGAVAVYRAGRLVAGPYIRRYLTTVDTHGRAVDCYCLPRLADERLGTEQAPSVTGPAVRWIETTRGYEPGEPVDEAA
jgi:hypothetical protein